MEEYEVLFNKAIGIKSRCETLLNELNEKVSHLEEEKLTLAKQIRFEQIYEKAISYLKEIIDVLSRNQIKHLENLLNTAVQTIFFDRKYRIEFKVEEFRNNNGLFIYLIETLEDGSEIKTNLEDNGFGVKTIVGFVLQVYFINYHKLSPILFSDEAFSTLSAQYIPYLKELFDSLKNEFGFIFVLVTHDNRLMEIADKSYTIKDGKIV